MKLISTYNKIIFVFALFAIMCNLCFANTSLEQSLSTSSTDNTDTKLNVNGQIFISEKLLKKKMRHSQHSSPQPSSNPNPPASSSSTNSPESNDLARVPENVEIPKVNPKTDSTFFNLGDGPIFKEVWIKYFKYTEMDTVGNNTPRKFFMNKEFHNQKKLFPKANIDELGSDGLRTYIKNQAYFYAILFSKSLNILTSKQEALQRTFDHINLIQMGNLLENKGYTDEGLQDFGNFIEGYCFKVVTTEPKKQFWIICTDTSEEKRQLMQLIKNLKIKIQRDQGLINIKIDDPAAPKGGDSLADLLRGPGEKPYLGKRNLTVSFNSTTSEKIVDCYWIMLQDWTQCSLKCGGGISTLHRMKVPAKNGGTECDGEPVMTRPCNLQPCSSIIPTSQKIFNTTTLSKKAVVRVLPFSNVPLRYSKCLIKEGDFMLTQRPEDIHSNNPTRQPPKRSQPDKTMPTRVVMNLRTISLFGGEDYSSLIITFNLESTIFRRPKEFKDCFMLDENDKQAILCPWAVNNIDNLINEWDYDYHLFKYQCHNDVETIDSFNMTAKLQEEVKKAKSQLILEEETEVRKKVEKKDIQEFYEKKKERKNIVLQAIKKELNLEEMVKKEEEEKEKMEEELILKQIEEEKKKKECITRAIKERKMESEYNLRQVEKEDELNSISKSAAQEVLIKRNLLKSTIGKMRISSSLKQNKLRQQLYNVRLSIAQSMHDAYKQGEAKHCVEAVKTDEGRFHYCVANFPDHLGNYSECKDGEGFCAMCCEHEFGELFITDRESCKRECEGVSEGGKKKSEEEKDRNKPGRWIYQVPVA